MLLNHRIHASSLIAADRRRCRSTQPDAASPSRRAIEDTLDWIDEIHVANRTWARNALALVSIVGGLLLLGIKAGLLAG